MAKGRLPKANAATAAPQSHWIHLGISMTFTPGRINEDNTLPTLDSVHSFPWQAQPKDAPQHNRRLHLTETVAP